MLIRIFKTLTRLTAYLFLSGMITLVASRVITAVYANSRSYTADTLPQKPVAIVFGAGVRWDGSPSAVLRARVRTAVDLYTKGKVETLLMSGQAPEPEAMRQYAVQLSVPEEDIFLDEGGLRTYDTCYRARQSLGEEEVALVTQAFHLPRALYTCNALGLPADGVPATQRSYHRGALVYWNVRETFATMLAFWEIHVSMPPPTLASLPATTSLETP